MSALPRLVAASLLAALVASPVLLDACLFTCHETTDIAASQSEPSCHHDIESADVRLEPPASPCGHDHTPSPSTMTAQARGADGRCDLGFVVWDSFALRHVANPESPAPTVVASIPRTCGRASTPLRI